ADPLRHPQRPGVVGQTPSPPRYRVLQRKQRSSAFAVLAGRLSFSYRYPVNENGRLRIFCVEDNAEMRARIDGELAGITGIDVVGHSETAAEALLAIRRFQPDAVVLDLQLSEGTGLDVLKGLGEEVRKPVILVLTNQSDSTSRLRSLRAGAS